MPSGQHGSPFSPLRIGTGCTPSSPSASRAQYRTVMNSLRRLATDLRDQRLLLGQRREFRRVGVHLGGGERLRAAGQHAGEQRRRDRHDCLALMRCCIFSACSRISCVISKCPPNSLR